MEGCRKLGKARGKERQGICVKALEEVGKGSFWDIFWCKMLSQGRHSCRQPIGTVQGLWLIFLWENGGKGGNGVESLLTM